MDSSRFNSVVVHVRVVFVASNHKMTNHVIRLPLMSDVSFLDLAEMMRNERMIHPDFSRFHWTVRHNNSEKTPIDSLLVPGTPAPYRNFVLIKTWMPYKRLRKR